MVSAKLLIACWELLTPGELRMVSPELLAPGELGMVPRNSWNWPSAPEVHRNQAVMLMTILAGPAACLTALFVHARRAQGLRAPS